MSDDFGYCESCGKRITGEDFGYGDAVRKDGRIYCIDCYKQSSAETGAMPARPSAPKRRSPSTRSMPAQGSRRRLGRKKRSPSSRRESVARGGSGGSTSAGPPRKAQVQKVAASVVCPYCSEKLVVKVAAFPCNHVCDLCRKVMRIEAP